MKYAIERLCDAAQEINDTAFLFGLPAWHVRDLDWAIEKLKAARGCSHPIIDCVAEQVDGDTYRMEAAE